MTLNIRRAALGAVLLLGAHSAFANLADDARALMAQGQFAPALQKLDQHLAKNPQDAEARFARGLALTKLNRVPEALKAFTDLTRDYPQLPEPYNNLAVLYAQQGDYDKAREALEAALATHPSYATAHENLGDIYAALAGASYNRALMLDKTNDGVRYKLGLIAQVEKPADNVLIAKNNKPAPVAATPVAAAPVVKAAPVAVAPLAPVPAPATTAATKAAPESADAAVAALLSNWTTAWSSKDAAGYLALYADDYAPEGGQLRAAWADQRRERILKPARIQVSVKNTKIVRTAPDRVSVSFVQSYKSDNYSDTVNKTLDLQQSNGAWKIVREYTR